MPGIKEIEFILLALCKNNMSVVADGNPCFCAVKTEQVYRADSCKLPYIQTLYKCTFDATNQLATCIICTNCALLANHMCMALQHLSARPSWSVV